MEEDTGKTVHVGGGGRIHEADHSLVDYNRAGVPLMEIVSRPDIRRPSRRARTSTSCAAVLEAIGVSDVKMEEGSMRVDANVSLRPVGTDGARHQGRDQEHELAAVARPGDRLRDRAPDRDARRRRAHRAGDAPLGRSRRASPTACASKEGSSDYRYFPEPDLVPGRADRRAAIGGPRRRCPELPAARRARLVADWGIGGADARVAARRARSRRLRRGRGGRARGGTAQRRRELVHRRRARPTSTRAGSRPRCCRSRPTVSPSSSASSPTARCRGTWPRTCSTKRLREPKRPKQVVEERGLAQVSDEGELGVRRRRGHRRATPTPSRSTAPATTRRGRRSAASSWVRR